MLYDPTEGAWSDDVAAVDVATSTFLWGPETMSAVSCETDPPGDPNFCMLRPRIGSRQRVVSPQPRRR